MYDVYVSTDIVDIAIANFLYPLRVLHCYGHHQQTTNFLHPLRVLHYYGQYQQP